MSWVFAYFSSQSEATELGSAVIAEMQQNEFFIRRRKVADTGFSHEQMITKTKFYLKKIDEIRGRPNKITYAKFMMEFILEEGGQNGWLKKQQRFTRTLVKKIEELAKEEDVFEKYIGPAKSFLISNE